ncbi:GGDEF domain-containing protein [Neptuniibacter sp.]|uniref:GGDEF domain-containing protein n=1 Tax=Neptuniibacter sp. TaxID=1962643 RepID=UPI002633B261|nr:GGDEF domain-containing protein [Neptuniibacter sp.]MCP4597353.1 GGDEF domain-containing protein [Neptuniibacter sp.]
MKTPRDEIQERILTLKENAVSRLIKGVFLLGLIAVPLSVSRALYTGWLPAYTVHISALCFFAVMYFLPNKLPIQFRVWSILIFSALIGGIGILNYGAVGNGMMWAMFSLIIGLFFISNRAALITGCILLTVFAFSLYRFVFLGYGFPGSADLYVASFASWATTLFGSIMFVVLIAVTITEHRQEMDELLLKLSEQNQTIEEQKQHIEYQANHDALTGLPTLRLANDRLEMALKLAKRQDTKAALLFLDLDGFKAINDNYGHDCGDHILKNCAERISAEIRESDTACRIGGDEFLVVLSQIESDKDITQLCERLVSSIKQPINYGSHNLFVTVSIGASVYPSHGDGSENLRRSADQAMYQAKKSGKNNYHISIA